MQNAPIFICDEVVSQRVVSIYLEYILPTIVNVGWEKHQIHYNETKQNETVGGQYNNFFGCVFQLPNGSHLAKQRNTAKWNMMKRWNAKEGENEKCEIK